MQDVGNSKVATGCFTDGHRRRNIGLRTPSSTQPLDPDTPLPIRQWQQRYEHYFRPHWQEGNAGKGMRERLEL
jgi:hypothetical protein